MPVSHTAGLISGNPARDFGYKAMSQVYQFAVAVIVWSSSSAFPVPVLLLGLSKMRSSVCRAGCIAVNFRHIHSALGDLNRSLGNG